MKQARILLIGSKGQLASEFSLLLPQLENHFIAARGSCHLPLDLTEPKTIKKVVETSQPDIIINTAAYTQVDLAEDEQELAFRINANAVAELAMEARKNNALLVHFSTDYIFDGNKSTPYIEPDQTAPLNVYGASKLAGEQTIIDAGCHHLIFRTSWVYSQYGHNFLKTMLKLAKEREEFSIVNDQVSSPTWSRMIAHTVWSILETLWQRENLAIKKVYHLSNHGEASWYDFASLIFQLTSNSVKLSPIDSDGFPTKAKRPGYSKLSSNQLEKDFHINLPSWQESLKQCLSLMSKGK